MHLPHRPKQDKIRIACVGDSLTYGCFVPGQPRYHYPAQLGRLLGSRYQVVNFGYTNHTAQTSGDWPYTARALYRKSLDFAPDVVLLMLGSNDSKTHNWNATGYEKDLQALVESYQNLESRPEIYLLMPPPAYPRKGRVLWGIRPQVIEREICPIIRQVAETTGVNLIDLHTPFVGHPEFFIEGVHTNRRGATYMATLLCEALAPYRHAAHPSGRLGEAVLSSMNRATHARMADWGLDFLAKTLDRDPPAWSALCDFGCGGGRNVGALLDRYPAATVLGYDYSEAAIRTASSYNAAAIKEGRCQILQGDVGQISLAEESLDLATAFETIYFWPNFPDCCRQVGKTLRPGGQFLIVNEEEGKAPGEKRTVQDTNLRIYTGEEIRCALSAAGFTDIRMDRHREEGWIAVLGTKPRF